MKKFNPIKLKATICAKFGNVKRFSQLSGVSYQMLSNLINERYSGAKLNEHLDIIESLIQTTRNIVLDGELTETHREMVRIEILLKFKTIKRFVELHPEFSAAYISAIKNGQKVKIDDRVKSLFKVLKIKI